MLNELLLILQLANHCDIHSLEQRNTTVTTSIGYGFQLHQC